MTIKRNQLFGSAADMGSDDELERELTQAEAENAAIEASEAEAAEAEEFQKKMAKRGTRGIKKLA